MPRFKGFRSVTSGLVVAGLVCLSSLLAAPNAVAEARVASAAGSDRIGSARYSIPGSAVFVSTSGSDSNQGTESSPVRTLKRGLAVVPSGGTVVLRRGSYNEYAIVTKKVAIQNYPGEEVWLDGSVPVTNWVRDGSRWRSDGWSVRFDHSPTYTQGAPESTKPDWQFVDPVSAPMAAHPDQVWIGSSRLRQVKNLSLVGSGAFYLDEGTSRLYVGSDPGGQQVRASNIAQALSVRASGVTIRGIGVRRYAPSVWHMGTVVLEQPDARIENVRLSENATTGLSVLASGVTLRKVTTEYSGMLGIHARFSDGLTIDRVLSQGNNSESFNHAPVSGGLKITQARGVEVTGSAFSNNNGPGFWQDMSIYNSVFSANDFVGNATDGLFLEISAKAIVGDNLFFNNRKDGIKVNNTSNVKIWNNTFVGNGRPLDLVQDTRRNTNRSDPAVDPRVSWPDPEMPWELDSVVVANNVVALSTNAANCLLCVEDYSNKETAESMRVTANGNLYNRESASRPSWLAVWSTGAENPKLFTTLSAFKGSTGQESRGFEITGTKVVSSTGVLNAAHQSNSSSIALPLPSDVANAIGRATGIARLGAWVDSPGTVTPGPEPTQPQPTLPVSTVLAQDDFGRNVTSGWGRADTGGSWTVPAGGSKVFVSGEKGRMRLSPGDGFEARLDSTSTSNADVTLTLSADTDSGSVGHWVDVIGRHVPGAGEYRGKLKLASNEPVELWLLKTVDGAHSVFADTTLSGVTYRAGETLKLRLQVTGTDGTTLRMKAWKSTVTEPVSWSTSASDQTAGLQRAGSTGVYAYTGGSTTNGPVVVSVDAWQLRTS